MNTVEIDHRMLWPQDEPWPILLLPVRIQEGSRIQYGMEKTKALVYVPEDRFGLEADVDWSGVA
jgi:hypothetical protein